MGIGSCVKFSYERISKIEAKNAVRLFAKLLGETTLPTILLSLATGQYLGNPLGPGYWQKLSPLVDELSCSGLFLELDGQPPCPIP